MRCEEAEAQSISEVPEDRAGASFPGSSGVLEVFNEITLRPVCRVTRPVDQYRWQL